jgi:hypothetical protein
MERAKLQHDEAVGNDTTSVRTALRLHACTFYSTVRSQPRPGVCMPTADCTAEEEGHAGTASACSISRAHAGIHAPLRNIALKHETLNMKQMKYTSKTTETFEICILQHMCEAYTTSR